MKLLLLAHADEDTLLVVHEGELLKYANDYRIVQSLCLYAPKEVCAAFELFIAKGIQLRAGF